MRKSLGNVEFKRLSDMVHNTVRVAKRLSKQNKNIREKWEKVVGKEISVHTEARAVKRGTLYVKVDSAAWLHHIAAFKKEEILRLIQEEFKEIYISEIRFYVGVI